MRRSARSLGPFARPLLALSALLAVLLTPGCDDMVVQPKQKTYSPAVGPAAVPVGRVDYESRVPQAPRLSLALLERGRERFHIYCTPCHSELGDGQGMIVQRGFPAPPSYHIDQLRAAPPQYFFDVITHGHGAMYSFAERVQPDDRWAIAAYIKALQRSQQATPADVPPGAQGALQ